jgi:hypothetical protein
MSTNMWNQNPYLGNLDKHGESSIIANSDWRYCSIASSSFSGPLWSSASDACPESVWSTACTHPLTLRTIVIVVWVNQTPFSPLLAFVNQTIFPFASLSQPNAIFPFPRLSQPNAFSPLLAWVNQMPFSPFLAWFNQMPFSPLLAWVNQMPFSPLLAWIN